MTSNIRKIALALAFLVTMTGASQAQWQVWAGRLAWAGAGAFAYHTWQRYHYGPPYGYGYPPPWAMRRNYGYYGYYGPPRYAYGGW
jgi:hypothetical protein